MQPSVLSPPLPNPRDHLRWGNLASGADALAVAKLAHGLRSPLVVLCADGASAERWEQDLGFFLGDAAASPVWRLPDWETLPYDRFSPHQDLISDRLHALYRLTRGGAGVLVVPVTTLMQRIAPVDFVGASSLVLKTGQTLPLAQLRAALDRAGYRAVETVFEHGQFAVRGSILDLFPMGSEEPLRIEWFDDEIETLRHFDPDSQRSRDSIPGISLLPGREFPFHEEAIAAFRRRWHARFDNDHRLCPDYQEICRGVAPGGIEYYLPLFFDGCATLFDYLAEDCLICVEERAYAQLDLGWSSLNERHASLGGDITRPLLRPDEICLPPDELRARLKRYARIEIAPGPQPARAGASNFRVAETAAPGESDRGAAEPLARLKQLLQTPRDRLLFCADSPGRREMLLEMLGRAGARVQAATGWADFLARDARCGLVVAPLSADFVLEEPSLAVFTEASLFGRRVLQRRRRARGEDAHESVVRNLSELDVGAPVVHIEHGVGRYRGLQALDVDGQRAEFLCIEYAEGARLFVPVASLEMVSRYAGTVADDVPLHRLGSDQWQRARRKAAEKIRDVAAELLAVQARRQARPGTALPHPGVAYESFAASFPFEETPDQLAAIDAVIADLCSPRAMDRLVCGDVGFGKTEVAMRAAFVAVHAGRQVAVLVPTTLLAQQHFETFSDRFADLPVTIESLSRFKSATEQKRILSRLERGEIDILIGTHSLLRSNLNHRNIGLVIIDEEHRFGVRQKEQLKALRASVDILTLTATPIPRTLNMALAGLRDLSIISTPPARRLSVKTFVQRSDNGLIRDAVNRELRRGGQAFFLHNDVKSIDRRATELRALLPEARIAVAHGQMRERDLERVMSDFYHKRYSVLCCSTIIETGIDIPNANTIVIERADRFGLAQLHQLRGRVGRSHHQAYAFLLTPDERDMTPDAVKRLEALAGTESLGAGFLLATHDLEIRGAGELLGEDQSGQIQAVGYGLYMELLDRAVQAMRAGRLADADLAFRPALEINLRLPALIPEDYLPDVHLRLMLYKRITSAGSEAQLHALEVEMIDRFGLLPGAVRNLLRIARIRNAATPLGINRIEASPAGGLVEFAGQTVVDPLTIVKLVQQDSRRYRLEGGSRLRFTAQLDDPQARFAFVEQLIAHLAAPAATTGKLAGAG